MLQKQHNSIIGSRCLGVKVLVVGGRRGGLCGERLGLVQMDLLQGRAEPSS